MKTNLKTKIRKAVLDMMSKVELDDKHNYTRKSDKKLLAGVSSVSSIMPKDFLAPWASKETVKFLGYEDKELAEKMIKKISKLDIKKYQALLHRAKNARFIKSEKALADGTKGHEYLEAIVKSKIRKQPIPKVDYGNLERPIKQFLKWEKENIKEWYLSEAMVYDEKNEFCGTLDGLALTKDNKLAVIDFKFSNKISDEYHLQTAGYSKPFEQYDIKIEDRIIIRLPKTLTKQVYNRSTRSYDEVPNNIEIGRSPFPLEFDMETFLNARVLYKYINATKEYFKRSANKKVIKI